MKLKSVPFSLALSCVGGLLPTIGQAQSANQPTNVVIMIADDISSNDLGCYGHPVVKTPNIDQLAKNGVRFTNAFLTTSSCSPSRSSIITGRYPHNTGACELHSPLPENQVVFPKLLKEKGYYTAQAGKWHFGASPVEPTGVAKDGFDRTGGSSKDGGGYSGAEKWIDYLKERPKDQPFFMWFASHDAHRKWDEDIFLPSYQPDEVIVPPYMVDNMETRKDLVAYYNEVSRFDYFVGQVVKELEAQNILDNTLLIVMADNGRPFPRDKTRLYDSGIKTPFVIHCPDLIPNPGVVSKSLLSAIDIAPTILEIAGGQKSETFQGESFADLLKNPQEPFRKYVFAEHNWHDFRSYERMVRTENYLYIENAFPKQNMVGAQDVMTGGAGRALQKGYEAGTLNDIQKGIYKIPQAERELYNCKNDSLQLNNVVHEQKYQKELKNLRRVLHKWQAATHDSKPQTLTKDWYSRTDGEPLPEKGIRGQMPGVDKNASAIIKDKGEQAVYMEVNE